MPGKILLFCLLCIQSSMSQANESRGEVDLYCGPRCVAFLLEYFKVPDSSLMPIVKQLDAFDNEQGTTLSQLSQVLEKRGLRVQGYELPEDRMIESNSPVILRLTPEAIPSATGALGHFCVLLPTSDPLTARVWIGLDGVQEFPPQSLRPLISAHAVVVSNGQEPVVTYRQSSKLRTYFAAHLQMIRSIAISILICVTLLYVSRRRVVHQGDRK